MASWSVPAGEPAPATTRVQYQYSVSAVACGSGEFVAARCGVPGYPDNCWVDGNKFTFAYLAADQATATTKAGELAALIATNGGRIGLVGDVKVSVTEIEQSERDL